MNLLPVALLASTVAFAIVNADDSRQACSVLAKCMADAVGLRRHCDNITDIIRFQYPPKYTDPQKACLDHGLAVTQADYSRRDEKIACLETTLANTTIVTCDINKTADCQNLLSNYTAGQPQRQAVTSSLNLTRVQELVDDKFKKNLTNFEAAAAAKAASAAYAAADKELRDYLNNHSTECSTTASLIDTQCSVIAGCCSESWICDLDYQSSGRFRDYATKQLAYQVEHRVVYPPSCPAPAIITTPPTTTAPLTTSASTKGAGN